jgi:nitrogen regulatory protein P-II 1
LIKVDAIVKNEQLEPVKAALNAIEVHGMTVSNVYGCGMQKGFAAAEADDVDLQLINEVKFEIVVSDEKWADKVVDTIQRTAYTGEYGDGKIFTSEVRSAIRIRTGEAGYPALQ